MTTIATPPDSDAMRAHPLPTFGERVLAFARTLPRPVIAAA